MESTANSRATERGILAALLCLVGAILGFSSVPLFIKHFTGYLDAWTVNGVRYAVAALLLLPVVISLYDEKGASRRVWTAAVIPAAVNFLGQVFWALSPYYNDAAVVGFTQPAAFVFTMFFGLSLLPGDRPLARVPTFWLGASASIVGLVVMYAASLGRQGSTSILGLTVIGVTALFWGLYSVSVKRFMMDFPARLSFGVISLYTAAGLMALMFIKGEYSELRSLTPTNWALLILSGLIGIAFSHVLLYSVIKRIGAVVSSGATLVIPFISAIGAFLLLGETMSLWQWTGGIGLVAGAFLMLLAKAHVRPSARE